MPPPGPRLNRDWVGLRVATRNPAGNYYVKVPAGTEGEITSYSPGKAGIRVQFDPCETCGVAAFIAGFSRTQLDILTPHTEWPDTRGQTKRR